jgi:hypothetical protein
MLTMSLKVFDPEVADIISAVEFDHTGDYLATGDRGGRVVLFERNEGVLNSYGRKSLVNTNSSRSSNRMNLSLTI